ncbi:DUF433 domain-containing protein [Leptolyngbya sp. NIES-2104]|uniref:DUF433 domain-containing protein n=1 Tax=Leptolyngbya sp. NIES-2104 TaxID=1552121 RepID=UPI0006ECAFAA|nr:DUF433 domain-containing protein [Leptolyngbya sp. NIES-2104]GAP99295.1 hypothetical protein NIES2104_58560 [Leptolyngbya sp. NIES-2104]
MPFIFPIAAQSVPLAKNADGVILVGGTRVTLETLIHAFQQGATAEEIAAQYSSLDLADVYAVISYYLRNRDEIDRYLEQQQQLAKGVRAENEQRFPSAGLRDRLLARQKDRSR